MAGPVGDHRCTPAGPPRGLPALQGRGPPRRRQAGGFAAGRRRPASVGTTAQAHDSRYYPGRGISAARQ
eukprot:gene22590-26816_t